MTLFWLSAAVLVVSAGYGALMPLLPSWLKPLMQAEAQAQMARHVGWLSSAYTAGILLGALFWGVISDCHGRRPVLLLGMAGYVVSLVPLIDPGTIGLAAIYASRTATGFFVSAVVPIVPAMVAEHSPGALRAKRFAWLSALSLLGFLMGPALSAGGIWLSQAMSPLIAWPPTRWVVYACMTLGGGMMLGLAYSLPHPSARPWASEPSVAAHPTGSVPQASGRRRTHTLWTLNALVMLSLAGFELGIVLMGQTHAGLSPQNISLMFAECSLVMLLINGVLFFTGWLQKAAGKSLLAGGSALAIAGLALLAQHPTDDWIYFGIALTSGGTGLVLPAISYLAAGTAQKRLGMTMGGLASAAGLGQTAGASLAGVLFGSATQLAFAWLTLPLLAVLMVALTCHLDSTGPEY